MKNLLSLVVFLLRVAVAGIFVTSGIVKIMDPSRFLDDIQAFGILGYDHSFYVMAVLPWLELLCGVAVLTLRYSAAACVLLSVLTLGFIYFVRTARAAGLDIDCGCFGKWAVFSSYDNHLTFLWALLIVLGFLFVRTFAMARYRATMR